MDKSLEKSIKLTLPRLIQHFNKDYLLTFINTSEDNLQIYNTTLGSWIRVFTLRKERAVYKQFTKNGITNKDTMSEIIIIELHRHLNSNKNNHI